MIWIILNNALPNFLNLLKYHFPIMRCCRWHQSTLIWAQVLIWRIQRAPGSRGAASSSTSFRPWSTTSWDIFQLREIFFNFVRHLSTSWDIFQLREIFRKGDKNLFTGSVRKGGTPPPPCGIDSSTKTVHGFGGYSLSPPLRMDSVKRFLHSWHCWYRWYCWYCWPCWPYWHKMLCWHCWHFCSSLKRSEALFEANSKTLINQSPIWIKEMLARLKRWQCWYWWYVTQSPSHSMMMMMLVLIMMMTMTTMMFVSNGGRLVGCTSLIGFV